MPNLRSLKWRRKAVTGLAGWLNPHITMFHTTWRGALTVDPYELQQALKNGWQRDGVDGWKTKVDAKTGKVLFLPAANLVTYSGVNRSMDRTFNLSGTTGVVDSIGVDNGSNNPVAGTAYSSGTYSASGPGGGSTQYTIIALSSPSRSGQQVTGTGTFTNSNVTYAMRRLFLNCSTADSNGNLYAMTNTFTLDLTSFSSWSQVFQPTITGTGS